MKDTNNAPIKTGGGAAYSRVKQNNPNSPILHIIIPIYNVQKYLVECLDSIQNQSYMNFLAIMVDDCSSDDSLAIATRYAKADKRFILLQKPISEGAGMARNTGLDYIFTTLKPDKNAYIGFVDSDDVIAKDYFANLIYCLECRQMPVAKSFNVYRFNDDKYNKSIFAYRAGKSKGGLWSKNSQVEPWRALYRAEFLKYLRFAKVHFHEDISFSCIVNALAKKVAYTRTARYFYRQRAGSSGRTRPHPSESCANFAYMLEHFVKYDLLKSTKIHIDLVRDILQNAEDKYFTQLQSLINSYHFDEDILRFNPHLRVILQSQNYAEFCTKFKMPFMKRVKEYFRIDIRPYKVYIKLFGKVLCDKMWR